jgi:hypothetical protein
MLLLLPLLLLLLLRCNTSLTSRSPKSVIGSPRARSMVRTLPSSVGTTVLRMRLRSSKSRSSFSCSSCCLLLACRVQGLEDIRV